MSARRALLDSPIIEPSVRPNRAPECARRALIETDGFSFVANHPEVVDYQAKRAIELPAQLSEQPGCARRALDPDLEPLVLTASVRPSRALDFDEAPTLIAPPAFRKSKALRKPLSARKLLAAAGLVAAIGSTTGAWLTGPAAVMAASKQPTAISTVSAAPNRLDDDALNRNATRKAVAETATPTPSVTPTEEPAPAEPPFGVDTSIAPGQLAPLSVSEALTRAEAMVGSTQWEGLCLGMMADLYGYSTSGVGSAQIAAEQIIADGQMHTDMTDIPIGALIWYDGGPAGNPYGHVALYAGDGMVYSNGAHSAVGLMPLVEPDESWHQPVMGWSAVWLPYATK